MLHFAVAPKCNWQVPRQSLVLKCRVLAYKELAFVPDNACALGACSRRALARKWHRQREQEDDAADRAAEAQERGELPGPPDGVCPA